MTLPAASASHPFRRLAGVLCCLACLLGWAPALAQRSPAVDAEDARLTPEQRAERAEAARLKRDYVSRPVPPAVLARESELAVHAFQLRDYCNNPKIDNAFVKAQLEKFSRLSGRSEDCASIRAY